MYVYTNKRNVCERETENVGHRKDCNFFPLSNKSKHFKNLTKYLPTYIPKSQNYVEKFYYFSIYIPTILMDVEFKKKPFH